LTQLEPLPGILDVDIHEIPARPSRGEPEHLHYDIRFGCWSANEALRVGDGVLDVRWVRLDGEFSLPTDDSVRRALARLRGGRP
jgi:hypothetical protein